MFNQTVCALRFFYGVCLQQEWPVEQIPPGRRETKLPVVLSREEVGRLLGAVGNLKHRTIPPDATQGRGNPPIHFYPAHFPVRLLRATVTIPIVGQSGSVQQDCIGNALSRAGCKSHRNKNAAVTTLDVRPQSRVLNDMEHTRKIVGEFTKQAIYFAKLPGDAEATRLIIEMAGVSPDDDVLDVACGAGSVACAGARAARHVTGIDVTPAMIEQAQALQAQHELSNLSWHIGDVTELPFATNTFDVILTRYSFHHFIDAAIVLAEMVRVCKPAGCVLVADLVLPPQKIYRYDRMEKLRDPTHVGVLAESKLLELFTRHGLRDLQCSGYTFDLALDQLMQASLRSSGDADRVREMIAGDLGVDDLGINVHRRDNALWLSYPIAVVAGRKEA